MAIRLVDVIHTYPIAKECVISFFSKLEDVNTILL